ncbi:MAG: M23 family metallopeptidase [Brevinematales bacterium]|nr:M23 family metallopeptidase [Brevinematales bacterium]
MKTRILVLAIILSCINSFGIEISIFPTNYLERKGETIGIVIQETENLKVSSISLEEYFEYEIYKIQSNLVYSLIGIPYTITTNFNLNIKIKDINTDTIITKTIPFELKIDILSYAKRKPQKITSFEIKNEFNFKTNKFRIESFYTSRISNFSRPISGEIGDAYGVNRSRGGILYGRIHLGIDILREKGAKVFSTYDGIVSITSYERNAGNYVVVNHGYGVCSVYMHLSKILVQRGQFVTTKDVIGLVGSTGRSIGPHLHFGISINNIYVDPIPFFERNYSPENIITNGMKIKLIPKDTEISYVTNIQTMNFD